MQEDEQGGEEGKYTLFTLRITKDLYEKVRTISDYNRVPVSATLRRAIKLFVADYTGEPTPDELQRQIRDLNSQFALLEARVKKLEEAIKNVS